MALVSLSKVLALRSSTSWRLPLSLAKPKTAVVQKATKDLEIAKSCLDKFAGLQPAAVTDVEASLLTCRQHKEGLTKTLQKAKVLLEQTFNWQIHHVSENIWL